MHDARSALNVTLDALAQYAENLNRQPQDLFDLPALRRVTGDSEEMIQAMLNREEVNEGDLRQRFVRRFEAALELRLSPDTGATYSLAVIAASYGQSKESLRKLLVGTGLPAAHAQAGLEAFFGVDPGYLLSPSLPALDRALQPLLRQLSDEVIRASGARMSYRGFEDEDRLEGFSQLPPTDQDALRRMVAGLLVTKKTEPTQ
ncbi:hypothetical protein OG730_08305 [Streptomyces sp. NBC_01298]|uniref:hypothetical protein n=1 Tax=Streptomyces sp. NBC_01298 TaxID=2903817 RepID=UPI002E11AF49|nr:hypothetical protein OG730_08305 [Streptomyces sp. NBC_01298]